MHIQGKTNQIEKNKTKQKELLFSQSCPWGHLSRPTLPTGETQSTSSPSQALGSYSLFL